MGLIVSEFLSLKAYLFFTTEIIKILSRDGKGKRYREFVLNRLICKRADGPFGVLPGAPLFPFPDYTVQKVHFCSIIFSLEIFMASKNVDFIVLPGFDFWRLSRFFDDFFDFLIRNRIRGKNGGKAA